MPVVILRCRCRCNHVSLKRTGQAMSLRARALCVSTSRSTRPLSVYLFDILCHSPVTPQEQALEELEEKVAEVAAAEESEAAHEHAAKARLNFSRSASPLQFTATPIAVTAPTRSRAPRRRPSLRRPRLVGTSRRRQRSALSPRRLRPRPSWQRRTLQMPSPRSRRSRRCRSGSAWTRRSWLRRLGTMGQTCGTVLGPGSIRDRMRRASR